MCVAKSIDAMRSSGIRIICCNRKLFISRRINNLDIRVSIYVNACCLAAACATFKASPLPDILTVIGLDGDVDSPT